MGVDLGDAPHGLGAPLSEDHPGVWTDILRVLDETEVAAGLVPCPQVVTVHGHDGCCLSCAATMD